MNDGIKSFFELIDTITEKIGRPASLLVFIMTAVTTTEVVGRYVFDHPTIWAWPLNRQIFGLFILVAGAYAMSKDGHIRIEILYDHFPARIKLIARLITLCCFVIFMGVLIWQASWMGLNSLKMGEKIAGAFHMPVYPFKILIPICTFLFLLQGIAVICRRKD